MVRIILNYSCSPPQGKAAVFFKTGFDLPAAVCYHQNAISGYDGIGRHARFRFSCRETCRFDPCYPHHVRRSKHRSVSALRRKLHYVSSFFLLNCDPLRWARSLVWKRFFQIEPASLGFDLVPVKSKHRSVSALRRKLHYVSSFFLTNSSLWETGSDYLFYPLSAQPKPGAAVRARECRKVFSAPCSGVFSHHCAFGDRRRADTACACPPVWILSFRLRLGENGAHVGHFFAEGECDGLAVVGELVGISAFALFQQIREQER